jgi:hypothetical protein
MTRAGTSVVKVKGEAIAGWHLKFMQMQPFTGIHPVKS